LVYRLTQCGARASGAYQDPIASPARFLVRAVLHIPVLSADALVGLPAEGAILVRSFPSSSRG
jgi:hypothetical protein